MAPYCVIAIDGPAASGKSSVARRLAADLGFAYVNSGSLYRAVAWLAEERGVGPENVAGIAALLREARFDFGLRDNASIILIDGINPEPYLRSEGVNRLVSKISALGAVREFLLGPLRGYADKANVVMEGRDIGSTVFPDAPHKFYIDASPEVRARRRAAQGHRDDLAFRDRLDVSRPSSPLAVPPGAEVIDTSELSLDQVMEILRQRLGAKGLRGTSDRHA